MFVHFVKSTVWIIGVLRLFDDAQEHKFLFSELFDKSSCHEAFDGFLDEGDLLFFLGLFIIVEDFVALFFLGDFFELLFLEVDGFESSDDTLSSSFDFLYYSDGGFHVGVEGSSFLNNFLLR